MASQQWPLKGSTRIEKLMAAGMMLQLWLLWCGLYALAWLLQR